MISKCDLFDDVYREQKEARFRTELAELINKHSMENFSNTPDYILADYLTECLMLFSCHVNKRSSYYGRFDKP